LRVEAFFHDSCKRGANDKINQFYISIEKQRKFANGDKYVNISRALVNLRAMTILKAKARHRITFSVLLIRI